MPGEWVYRPFWVHVSAGTAACQPARDARPSQDVVRARRTFAPVAMWLLPSGPSRCGIGHCDATSPRCRVTLPSAAWGGAPSPPGNHKLCVVRELAGLAVTLSCKFVSRETQRDRRPPCGMLVLMKPDWFGGSKSSDAPTSAVGLVAAAIRRVNLRLGARSAVSDLWRGLVFRRFPGQWGPQRSFWSPSVGGLFGCRAAGTGGFGILPLNQQVLGDISTVTTWLREHRWVQQRSEPCTLRRSANCEPLEPKEHRFTWNRVRKDRSDSSRHHRLPARTVSRETRMGALVRPYLGAMGLFVRPGSQEQPLHVGRVVPS